MSKYYFKENEDEYCYDKTSLLEMMKEDECKEQKVFEAERQTGEKFFWCKEFWEVGEVGESCGKICPKYVPNNGKNGRCRHYGYTYEKTNKSIILKL